MGRYTRTARGVPKGGWRCLLPIVHVKEERGGGLVQVAVGQQLLQLLHQVVFVRGAQTAELVQQVLVQIVVEIHGLAASRTVPRTTDGSMPHVTSCQRAVNPVSSPSSSSSSSSSSSCPQSRILNVILPSDTRPVSVLCISAVPSPEPSNSGALRGGRPLPSSPSPPLCRTDVDPDV